MILAIFLNALGGLGTISVAQTAPGDENWDDRFTLAGTSSTVIALAFDSSRNLYAGGSLGTAGGEIVNFVDKWNGSSWAALGSGINNTANALAVDNSGNLYTRGNFTTAGGKVSDLRCLHRFALDIGVGKCKMASARGNATITGQMPSTNSKYLVQSRINFHWLIAQANLSMRKVHSPLINHDD